MSWEIIFAIKCKFLYFRDHEKCVNFSIFIENGQIESIQCHEKWIFDEFSGGTWIFGRNLNSVTPVLGQFLSNWYIFYTESLKICLFEQKRVLGMKMGVSDVLTTVYSRAGELFVSIKYRGLDIKYK